MFSFIEVTGLAYIPYPFAVTFCDGEFEAVVLLEGLASLRDTLFYSHSVPASLQ